MNYASEGDKAIADANWPSAIRYFTQALIEHPRSPAYYIKRSTANSRLKPADGGPKCDDALRDAEIGLILARERGRRELIESAQLRRGVALFQLERYGDAKFVFETLKNKLSGRPAGGQSKNSAEGDNKNHASKGRTEQELSMWIAKAQMKLNKLEDGDNKAAITVSEYPSNVIVPTENESKQQLESIKSGMMDNAGTRSTPETKENKSESSAATEQLEGSGEDQNLSICSPAVPDSTRWVSETRYEWYQSSDSVVVMIYAKGVSEASVDANLKENYVSIKFPLISGGENYEFTLNPPLASIDPSSSTVSVNLTKIEVILKKQARSQKWSTLGVVSTSNDNKSTISNPTSAAGSKHFPFMQTSTATPPGPSYPTSSRQGPKDWDKIATSLTKKKAKPESTGSKDKAAGSKGEGYDSDETISLDSDYEGGDPVDAFFKKLYANADPDTRRAMVKSFTESQGTALSTNWEEVQKGKVETRSSRD